MITEVDVVVTDVAALLATNVLDGATATRTTGATATRTTGATATRTTSATTTNSQLGYCYSGCYRYTQANASKRLKIYTDNV